jgi:membrane-associated phospholipid phosphatase
LGWHDLREDEAISNQRALADDASGVEQADVAVTQALAGVQHHPVTRMLGVASELADQPQMVAINSATLAAGLLLGKPRLARAGARMLAAHLLATAIKHAIKRQVDRTRPYVLVEEGRYRMEPGHRKESKMNSFPSGHTAGAVAAAQAYAREIPEHAAPAAGIAASVAAIQIPRCTHYPSDIAAGLVIGSLSEAAVGKLGQRPLGWIAALATRRAERLAARQAASGEAA